MFTGIVREIGRVVGFDGNSLGRSIEVEAPATAAGLAIGDSVAVSGCCLTAVAVGEGRIAFEAVPETLARTTLGQLEVSSRVNIEPAVRAGEPLGGHYVQGHIDGRGTVRAAEPEGGGERVWVDVGEALLRQVIEKGSVTVDGVSLTVAELDESGFAVALVPHTLEVTTLGELVPGDLVNVETDVIAKYVERLLHR